MRKTQHESGQTGNKNKQRWRAAGKENKPQEIRQEKRKKESKKNQRPDNNPVQRKETTT